MNKQREALQLALEALTEVTGWQWAGPMRVMDEIEGAIAAIRKALAEPEPARKPLTDEEMLSIWRMRDYRGYSFEFARAIEKTHGIVTDNAKDKI